MHTELNRLRKLKKLSLKQMADILGISKTYYWQLENKKRKLSYKMACKIAFIFERTSDEVFYSDFLSEINIDVIHIY